jgi:hypothetical protein
MSSHPLVSIGMPVHNAEHHLGEAIDSLLAQDYQNIEVVISDNASTDGTESICRGYAHRDGRVTYNRSEQNRGAVWNFNRVFALARGPYFMWAAHDDIRDPRFVSSCVAELEARADAGMCCTEVAFIDEAGLPVEPWTKLFHPVGDSVRDRVSAIGRSRYWLDVYGLIRTEVLAQTTLAQPVWGFDVSVLLQLCLRAPVLMAPEPLFLYRVDREKTTEGVAATLGATETPGSIDVNWSAMALQLARDVWAAPLGVFHRVALLTQLMTQLCVFNGLVGSGIRRDVFRSLRGAWTERRFGRVASLCVMAAVVLPVHNRPVRAVVRMARRPNRAPQPHV